MEQIAYLKIFSQHSFIENSGILYRSTLLKKDRKYQDKSK
jgi:hypothetical protein